MLLNATARLSNRWSPAIRAAIAERLESLKYLKPRSCADINSASDSLVYQAVPASKSEFLRLQSRVDDLSKTVLNMDQAMVRMQNTMEAIIINNNVTSTGGTGTGGAGGNGTGGAGGTGASANGGQGR